MSENFITNTIKGTETRKANVGVQLFDLKMID